MTRVFVAGSLLALLTAAGARAQQEMPDMPKPQKEHKWLEQFAGEWDVETIVKPPGQDEMKVKGTEKSRMVGGFWYISESQGDMLGTPFTGIMTLGYDPRTKKYVGTWVDSMTDYIWHYTGKVDGNTITLEAKGPCPMKPPGTMVNFRETLEIKDKDHKTFTSSMQEDDGSWTKLVTMNYTRKK